MRDRGSVVLIENNKVALIKRTREDAVYYVFPGGGIEEGETLEMGAVREAFEELGVRVQLNELLATVNFNGAAQYFFLANILEGTFGTGEGEEFHNELRGSYLPIWVDVEDLPNLDVKPEEASLKLQAMFIDRAL